MLTDKWLMRHLGYVVSTFFAVLYLIITTGCSSDKFLSEGEYLLSDVEIASDTKTVKSTEYRRYVRQEPNARWFNLLKVQLGIHNMAGTDTTKWGNRLLQRIGEAPVVYDGMQTDNTLDYLTLALRNKGYLSGYATDSVHTKNRKKKVIYTLHPGARYTINNIYYDIPDTTMSRILHSADHERLIYRGMPASTTLLDEERNRLVLLMQNNGYYRFHRELITFSADTVRGSKTMDLTMHLVTPTGLDSLAAFGKYHIGSVTIDVGMPEENGWTDSTIIDGKKLRYNGHSPISTKMLADNIRIAPDSMYREANVRDSYSAIGRFKALRYTTIRFAEDTAERKIDVLALTMPAKPNSISAELEGTNTSGDLGAAASVTFANRNVFRHSETLSLKLRGAYEAITGLEGYSNRNYVEFGGELGMSLHGFALPLLSKKFKRSINATSELSVSYNLQNRPEYHRRVTTGIWRYRWNKYDSRWQHRVDLLSINYVSMPWISETFRREYIESTSSRYSLMRYLYENLFIMNTGYNFVYNSRKVSHANAYLSDSYQLRMNVESAGNLLYALSKPLNLEKDDFGQYKIFGVAYSQYVKADFDFVKNFTINENNSLAVHAAFGIALPYGNSSVIPFEKRYFAGGANSVRGWSVRELGPGSYSGTDGTMNYVVQTGNLKLAMSVEYRTWLFWKLHGAAFIDAGNIWNTRNYADTEGGQFKFDTFYKQIAVSYGIGLRFNFDYFILRFDGGMKAISPLYDSGRNKYPIIHPKFSRDFTLHFAVGMPF